MRDDVGDTEKLETPAESDLSGIAAARKRVMLAAYATTIAGGLLIAAFGAIGLAPLPSPAVIAGTAIVAIVWLVAMQREIPGARILAALYVASACGLLMPEPFVSEQASAAVFLPAILGLMLRGPLTMLSVALLPIVILALRAPSPSPYLQPAFLVITALVHGTLLAAHRLLDRALGAAATQARRLRAITSETNDVVVIRGVSAAGGFGELSFISPSVERVLGYTPREYRQLDLRRLVHPDDYAELSRAEDIVRLQPGHTVTMEVRAKHKAGHWTWIESRATNLCAHPDVRGFVLIFHDVTAARHDREHFERVLEHQAMHDALTGLPNRRQLLHALAQAIEHARATSTPLSIVFCDLDHFKVVNDSLGHDAGDTLLQSIAETIAGSLGPHDSVARFGGDEFVVICRGQDGEYATNLAYRLLESIAQSALDPRLDSRALHVSMSMGIAELKEHERPEDLLRDADVAMYSAKDSGRARAEAFDAAMRTRAFRRHELEQALWRALEDDEFELAFQPKVSLDRMSLLGFEALLRWRIAGTAAIGPADFIPIAEDTGAIVPIGRWVLEHACEKIRQWQKKRAHLTMAVNLSGRQLHHHGIVEEVARAIAKTGIAPGTLELEITESVVMTNAHAAIARLYELKQLGVKLAIDDFGTGYSSLSYLRRLPVDVLKIDRAFVSGLGRDPEDIEIVRLVVTMAKALGLVTVAEGVETREHIEELRMLGCSVAQGFFFSHPMSEREVEAILDGDDRNFFSQAIMLR